MPDIHICIMSTIKTVKCNKYLMTMRCACTWMIISIEEQCCHKHANFVYVLQNNVVASWCLLFYLKKIVQDIVK